MIDEEFLNQFKNKLYVGVLSGQYDETCLLNLEEIPCFLQNAGLYANLEIIDLKENEILLNSKGQFINQIYPELSRNDREMVREYINYVATIIQSYYPENFEHAFSTPKIKEFIEKSFGQDRLVQHLE